MMITINRMFDLIRDEWRIEKDEKYFPPLLSALILLYLFSLFSLASS